MGHKAAAAPKKTKKRVVKKAPTRKVTRLATRKHDQREAKLLVKVEEIQALRAVGVASEADAMFQTHKLFLMPALWRTSARRSKEVEFEDEVVKKHHLCTSIARWRAFVKALKHKSITKGHIRTLGIPAICLIMKQDPPRRWKLVMKAVRFRENNGVEPTYQFITQAIGARTKECPKCQHHNTGRLCTKCGTPIGKPTYSEVVRHNEALKVAIRKLGGRVPKMERF